MLLLGMRQSMIKVESAMVEAVDTSKVAKVGTSSTLITRGATTVLALSAFRSRPISNTAQLVSLGVRSIRNVSELRAKINRSPAARGVGQRRQLEVSHGCVKRSKGVLLEAWAERSLFSDLVFVLVHPALSTDRSPLIRHGRHQNRTNCAQC